MRHSSRRQSQRGTALLEAALISLGFLSMLIAAFDFGQFLFVHQALVERARMALRYGEVNDPTASDSIRNMVVYGQATSGSSGYFGLTGSMVDVTATGANTDNYRLTILIHDYPYKMLSPYLAGSYTGPNIQVTVPLGMFN